MDIPDEKIVKSKRLLRIELDNGKTTLFSNISGQIAVIDNELENLLEKFKVPINPKDVCNNNPVYEKAIKELLNNHILVKASADEDQLLRETIETYRNSSSYSFTWVLTMKCNFRCIYCYEEKQNIDMSWEVAEKSIDFVVEKIKESKQKELNIIFYGGEPLLKFNLMKRILKTLKERLPSDIKIHVRLVTNGSLITDKIKDFLKMYDYSSVQLTIDGLSDIHNKRRPYKNGKGSFNDVMAGLKNSLELNSVSLRINIDKTNKENAIEFLKILKSQGFQRRNLSISFGQVLGNLGEGKKCKYECISVFDWSKDNLELICKARELGFNSGTAVPRITFCGAYIPKNLSFNPDGSIIPCMDGVGVRNNNVFVIGHLFNNPIIFKEKTDIFWKRTSVDFEECRKCDIVAFCGGGCLGIAYTENGTFNSVYCPFYKYNFKDHIKLYIKDCLSSKNHHVKVNFDNIKSAT